MNGYEVGNRAIATQATTEARSTEGAAGDTGDVMPGKVVTVTGDTYTVAALDESGLTLEMYSMVTGGEGLAVNDTVTLKVDSRGNAVILSSGGGGGSSCAVSINSFGVLFG